MGLTSRTRQPPGAGRPHAPKPAAQTGRKGLRAESTQGFVSAAQPCSPGGWLIKRIGSAERGHAMAIRPALLPWSVGPARRCLQSPDRLAA